MSVKLVLFKSFCLCLYNVALWNRFRIGVMNKFRSCYTKCAKMFLGFTKYYCKKLNSLKHLVRTTVAELNN